MIASSMPPWRLAGLILAAGTSINKRDQEELTFFLEKNVGYP